MTTPEITPLQNPQRDYQVRIEQATLNGLYQTADVLGRSVVDVFNTAVFGFQVDNPRDGSRKILSANAIEAWRESKPFGQETRLGSLAVGSEAYVALSEIGSGAGQFVPEEELATLVAKSGILGARRDLNWPDMFARYQESFSNPTKIRNLEI